MRLPPHVPVLVRRGADGALDAQIGLSGPAIVRGLGIDELAFVASLEGGKPVTSPQQSRFSRVCEELTAAGAWERMPDAVAGSIAIVGCGSLGMAIAEALADSELGVVLDDAAPLAVEPVGIFGDVGGGTCAGAAAQALLDRGVRARVGPAPVDITAVLCFGSPDPQTIDVLMRRDSPHLIVAWMGASVWVSHVIVPGWTACSRCRDLELARIDSEWPSLALQLSTTGIRSRRPIALGLSRLAVAVEVAKRARAWLRDCDPGTACEVRPNGEVTASPLAADVDCGCGAAGAVGDEVAARRAQWRETMPRMSAP